LRGFNMVMRDVSVRRKAEQKVSDLLEGAPDAMVAVNQGVQLALLQSGVLRATAAHKEALIYGSRTGCAMKEAAPDAMVISDGSGGVVTQHPLPIRFSWWETAPAMSLRNAKVQNNLHVVLDGTEATSFLWRQGKHANALRPDLILLDLNLPKKGGRGPGSVRESRQVHR
jgi:hypothetical protein